MKAAVECCVKHMYKADVKRHFLLGNEAVARGALEAGLQVAAGYPGTPSSEVTETLASTMAETGIHVEYSTNEIVALETAAGAAICGVRAMAIMKHVGLNVASDALITLAYTGVKGGLVVVSADDPNCHSSQNEQDNRYYSRLANIPCLEPSSPQEAKDMTVYGFHLSEELELPVLLRMTTRISHSRGSAVLGPIVKKHGGGSLTKDTKRFVMLPANAMIQHRVLVEKMDKAKQISEESLFNGVEGKGARGIITSGGSYNYTMEALQILDADASVLKLGMIHPMPEQLIADFVEKRDSVVIMEELEPYLEVQVKAISYDHGLKTPILGKATNLFPSVGELSTRLAVEGLSRAWGEHLPMDYVRIDSQAASGLKLAPPRPPIMCPGCPHMATLYALRMVTKGKAMYSTDIGCYTLGASPPIGVGDVLLCMGSGIGVSCGMERAVDVPVVGIVGDSTFFHASIPGLVNAVYNGHKVLLMVLDNLTTAMTGYQPHPGTGVRADGKPSTRILIEDVAKACGVGFVRVVDPYELGKTVSTIREALRFDGPAVIVARRACADQYAAEMRRSGRRLPSYRVVKERCTYRRFEAEGGMRETCLLCLRGLGCPALAVEGESVVINDSVCNGCGVCSQVCPSKAIEKVED